MKKYLFLLIVFFCAFSGLVHAESDFYVNDDKVYWRGDLLEINIDIESFVALSQIYAKDKNNVFTPSGVLIGADAQSFRVVSEKNGLYGADKQYVYFMDEVSNVADPMTIEADEIGFIKDKNNVYWRTWSSGFNVLDGADAATFKSIKEYYGYDKNYIYYSGYNAGSIHIEKVQRGGGPVIMLNEFIVTDDNKIYTLALYKGANIHIIDGVSVSSFRKLSGNYFTDDNNIYFNMASQLTVLENVDIGSFQVLSDTYAKDKNNIYSGDKILLNADYESFSVVDLESGKDNLYLADRTGYGKYVPVNLEYAKDKNNVYFSGKTMVGTDVRSFIPYGYYVKDKNNVYYASSFLEFKIVDDADMDTFEMVGGSYAKDKNNVYYAPYFTGPDKDGNFYYGPGVLKGADPMTFETIDDLNTSLARDKNHYYVAGDVTIDTFSIYTINELFENKKNNILLDESKNAKIQETEANKNIPELNQQIVHEELVNKKSLKGLIFSVIILIIGSLTSVGGIILLIKENKKNIR